MFCKLDNKQNANLRSNVAFIETPWERLNSSIDVMPAKESMMILRPRSHGGGDRGVTISHFPYPVLPPPVLFCPFVSRLPPIIVFLPLSCKSRCLTPYSNGEGFGSVQNTVPPILPGSHPPCPPPLTRIRIFLKTEIFFLPFFENLASTRSVLESFSPIIHTKTLKR